MAIVAPFRTPHARAYLLIGVLLSVVIAFGTRFTPHADAAEITAREEIGDFIFEMTDDNMIGITIKSLGIRWEDNLDAAPKDPTQQQLDAAASEVKDLVRKEYGWDLTSPTDRERIQDEMHRLGQALHTIPDSTLEVEEHKPVGALRDLVDHLEGRECRGRCLPQDDSTLYKVVSAAVVGSALAGMQAELADPSLPKEYVNTVMVGMAVTYTVQAALVFTAVEIFSKIGAAALRRGVLAGAISSLLYVRQGMEDAREIANTKSTTPKDGTRQEAREISTLTPEEGDDGHDYDAIKDEL